MKTTPKAQEGHQATVLIMVINQSRIYFRIKFSLFQNDLTLRSSENVFNKSNEKDLTLRTPKQTIPSFFVGCRFRSHINHQNRRSSTTREWNPRTAIPTDFLHKTRKGRSRPEHRSCQKMMSSIFGVHNHQTCHVGAVTASELAAGL